MQTSKTPAFSRTQMGRNHLDLRPIKIQTQVNRYAEGSALIQMGNTHVLCTASVEDSVPPWMAGSKRGWLTAEYAMLPRSTHTRVKRDREKISGRTQEIQRLIGRALRASVDLNVLGERTLYIDCDVLQADGGTRTAAINGGCVAAALAIQQLTNLGKVPASAFLETVSAVSVGILGEDVLVDLQYEEDSTCEVDMNFVITGSGNFIEIQGTAERGSFTKKQMDQMTQAAQEACRQIHNTQVEVLKS